jgi:hypothetical protein
MEQSDTRVGYGQPPKEHQFKPGNQAARGRRSPRKKQLSIDEALAKAMRQKHRIAHGGQFVLMDGVEILAAKVVQAITTSSPRDLVSLVNLVERLLPGAGANATEVLRVIYESAQGSTIALPSADALKKERS